MDQSDLLFALKDLFKDTNGKLVISHLMKFPLIMEFIHSRDNLKKIANALGDNSQSWTMHNLCEISNKWSEEKDKSVGDQTSLLDDHSRQINNYVKEISKIKGLSLIADYVENITSLKAKCSWGDVFSEIGLENYSGDDEKKSLETVFSAILETEVNKSDLIKGLLAFSKNYAGQKLLAHLIQLNKSLIDYLLSQSQIIFSDILLINFINFLRELQSLGELEKAQQLTKVFLEISPFSFEQYRRVNTDYLLQLQYLKNYASLFGISGSQSELTRLSLTAKEILENIENKFVQYVTSNNHSKQDSTDYRYTFDENIDDSNLIKSLKKLMQVSRSDNKSAKLIAEEIFTEISNGRFQINSIFHKEYGFQINPLDLINSFIDLNLIEKAQSLLRMLLKAWPLNADLLRLGSNFSYDHGNHQAAIKYFSELELIKELTREEKIKFAKSLEYFEKWNDAFLVRETINNSNDLEQIDKIICAFYADKLEILNQFISQKIEEISPFLYYIIQSISEDSKIDIQVFESEIVSAINSGRADKKGVFLGANYFQKTGENERAIRILESYQNNFGNDFELLNLLHNLYKKTGNKDKSQHICEIEIKEINNGQKYFEDFVEILLLNGNLEKTEKTLKFALDKWRLSPRKIDLNIKILVEKGQFRHAKGLLNDARSDYANDPDIIFDYCLASLNCRPSDFPFSLEENNPSKLESIKKLFFSIYKKDLLLHDLLLAEINSEDKIGAYKSLLKKYSNDVHSDFWRIHAGLGSAYFHQKQFDSAIANLKSAHEIEPENERIIQLLVESYIELGLWDEIEKLYSSNPLLGKQKIFNLISNSRGTFESRELLKFLQRQVQRYPEDVTQKIYLSQILSKIGRKEESVSLILGVLNQIRYDEENYLLCIQSLIDADELILAERSTEIFLANRKKLRVVDYLSIAFVFEQLGNFDKALAMLNHLDLLDPSLIIYKSQLISRLNNQESAESLIKKAFELIERPDVDLSEIQVQVPGIINDIRNNPYQIYLISSHLEIKNKNINAAISILKDGLIKNPESEEVLIELLTMLSIFSDNEKINACVDGNQNILDHFTSPILACLLGEIALSQGEEIKAAKYLSEALEYIPEHPRVKALQSRLVAKNGNLKEAQKLFGVMDMGLYISDSGNENVDETKNQVANTSSLLWLANALIELEEYSHALRICVVEIETFGFYIPLMACFLKALAPLLEKEIIKKEAKVNCQNSAITEKVISILKEILKYRYSDNTKSEQIEDKLIECQIFLDDPDSFMEIKKMDPDLKNLNAILYGTYRTKGKDSTEILFNSSKTDATHNIFMAALEKDDYPQLALSHIKRVIQHTKADDITYAFLAIIENKLGNYSDALAAISLALEKSPDEFSWLIMAGELSEKTGDMRSSLSFYERANEQKSLIDSKINIDSLIVNIGDERAIAILEEQLAMQISKEKLLKLGNILIKFGDYRKAINIFTQFIKEYPGDVTPYLWLAEISLRLDNTKKAIGFIEDGLSLDGKNVELICFKAHILKNLEGIEKAILFVDHKLDEFQNEEFELLFLKAEFLAEYKGYQVALEFLNTLRNFDTNPLILLEKAKIELRMGNLDYSEEIAEKLINEKDLASEALSVLGEVSKNKGELDRAIDFYIKAIDLKPFTSENFSNLADIYESMNEYKKAIETLEEGLKINVSDFKLLYKTGLYYYQHGLYQQAEKRIREAIKINPGHKDARNIITLLENARVVDGDKRLIVSGKN